MTKYAGTGFPFWISVAVSPFKYTEPDCAYQYLKLEKKIAAGADCAITQLGYDARKFRELKRYLDEHSLRTPLLGNVYVLHAKAAEKMSKGEPPGCWVSPELLEQMRHETRSADKGLAARLERAANMVAILRGLGYAGAYLGGDHRADHVRWIIRRSEALAPNWQELAERLSYAPNGFYLFESNPVPAKRRGFVPLALDALGRIFPVNKTGNCGVYSPRYFDGSTNDPLSRGASNASSLRSKPDSSDAKLAATACWATWNTCVRKLVPKACAMVHVVERYWDAAK